MSFTARLGGSSSDQSTASVDQSNASPRASEFDVDSEMAKLRDNVLSACGHLRLQRGYRYSPVFTLPQLLAGVPNFQVSSLDLVDNDQLLILLMDYFYY